MKWSWTKANQSLFVAIIIVVALLSVTRLMLVNVGLPYIEHFNEPNYYYAGLELRGLYDNHGFYDNFFSLYIVQSALVQTIFQITTIQTYVVIMRLINILYGIATVIWIMLIAYRLSNVIGAVGGGLLWIIGHIIVAEGYHAVPDAAVYCFTVGALWASYTAYATKKFSYLVLATCFGLVATLFKYNAFFALVPVALVNLYTLNYYRTWRLALFQVGSVVFVGIFLFLRVKNGTYGLTAYTGNGFSVSVLWDVSRFWSNFTMVLYPLNINIGLIILVGGGIVWLMTFRREARPSSLIGYALIIVTWISNSWVMNTFATPIDLNVIRYVFPSFSLACILIATSIVAIGDIFPRLQSWIALLLLAFIAIPRIEPMAEQLRLAQIPPVQAILHTWFDENLPIGEVLVNDVHHKTFNPEWGGLRLSGGWANWYVGTVEEKSVADWQSSSISYIVLDYAQWQALQGTPYASDMLHLKDFIADNETLRGNSTSVLRVQNIQTPLRNVNFGNLIQLKGYDLEAKTYQPGDRMELTFYWQAIQQPTVDYSLFVHLVPEVGTAPLAQADGALSRRSTLLWDDPNETLISAPFVLRLPETLKVGTYQVVIGVYDYTNNSRLPIITAQDATDYYVLTTLQVVSN